ncbi:multidrug effflux MFS transporter [Ruania alba]|uniref:MFS transporter, DHA1 family, bicyclomycin/chloramphenicol resistance protein n=1 Tax=Ruania alba TaxID=648782 RepID=A0A1H5NGJ9_9MICO|nr:multidrug effflux MFS transporter [Ruania alba]SEF00574.1 MFS transporter, DHA1 family, bicyclomycin/chloramphenicol resistance protein [Ruania alba]
MSRNPPESSRPPSPERVGLLFTIVLAGLAMIGPFTIDTIFPAFEQMGGQFRADTAAMQQVTSLYLLSFAVMSIFHGPISDAMGRKPVMIAGLIGFTMASIMCALAPSLPVLLAGRLLQGGFAGAATIVSRVVIRDLFSGSAAQRLMSNVMMIFSVAPAIAPVVGGWLLSIGPWQSIFWSIAGYGVVMAVLVGVVLPETLPTAERRPLNPPSVVRAVVRVATRGAVVRLALLTACTFGAQFTYIAAAPIIVVDLLGLGERDFWVLFVPLIGGIMVGAFISGRTADRVPRRRLIDIAMTFALVTVVVNVLIVAWQPSLPWAMIAPPIAATAVGTMFPVLNLEILDQAPDDRGAAASLGAFGTLFGNAILAGIIIPVVADSLLHLALTSLAYALLAMALWRWHRSRPGTMAANEA